MNNGKIKTMFNVEVINGIDDAPTRNILKNILFDDRNVIDWKNTYDLMMQFIPELKLYDGYKMENMM